MRRHGLRSTLWLAAAVVAVAVSSVLPGVAFAAGPVLRPSGVIASQPATATQPQVFPPSRHVRPVRVPDGRALAAAKAAARRGAPHGPAGPSAPSAAAPSAPITAVFGGLNQPGLRAVDNSPANQGSPPDTTGAIGPSHYLEFVNSKVAVYSRTTLGLLSQRDLDAFVGRAGEDVFDPQIQWDQQGGRWLYAAVDINSSGRNFLAFGWSKTADPSDLVNGWCRFTTSTDIGGRFIDDYPKLGHDDSRVILGANVFRNDFFQTAHVWSFAKPAPGVTSCSAPVLSIFGSTSSPLRTADGDLVFTPVPANAADSVAGGFVVAADWPPFGGSTHQIMVWHLGGSAGSPTLVADGNVEVGTYAVPANVPQPGTTNVLDSLDARLTQAVSHADPGAGGQAVWTQHTVAGSGGRAVVRWYELRPPSPSAFQQGVIQDPAHFVFNGAISPAVNGSSAAIFYNVGSSSLLAQIRAQARTVATTPGEMGGELTLGSSAAADRDFSCTSPYGPPCRWGDYAGASPDPVNEDVVWGSNQLNDPFTSDPHWATRNFAVTAADATGYVRPKGATPMIVSLVPGYDACLSTNRRHGGALSSGSCSTFSEASSHLTTGTPDANGAATNMAASARFDVCPVPGCAAPDVSMLVSVSDVRCQTPATTACGSANAAGGADYSGELRAQLPLRITDRYNGPSLSEPATVIDTSLDVNIPCAGTAGDTAEGATCSIATKANAVVPSSVVAGQRAIWAIGQIGVFDGGADGNGDTTGDNEPFLRQGVFLP